MSAMPSNAEKPEAGLNRRSFVTLLWKGLLGACGLLAAGGVARFLSYQPDPPRPTEFDLGPADSYPPGSRTVIQGAQAVLLRTQESFTALSLICPHLGCQVETAPGGFICPCHGSRFDQAGGLQRGPATRPMTKLRLELKDDGRLILHTQG